MAKRKSLKNKIRTEIIKIASVPPKRKGDTGYLKLTDEEIDKIVELFKKSIQRFIEETTLPIVKVKNEEEINTVKELLTEINQTQAKWLKENL